VDGRCSVSADFFSDEKLDATQALREHLESQGFGGLDSVGLLKSFRQE